MPNENLDGIQNLAQLNALLSFDPLNQLLFKPGEVKKSVIASPRSRIFHLRDSNNNEYHVKMYQIVSRFKELSEKEPNEMHLIGEIHDRVVELDLVGDIELSEEHGWTSMLARDIKNIFTPNHLKEINKIEDRLFTNPVKDKAKDIKKEFRDAQDKSTYALTLLKEALGQNENGNEEIKNAIRYITRKNPDLASGLLLALSKKLNQIDRDYLNPQEFISSFGRFIHSLRIEINARPEFREATIHNFSFRNQIQEIKNLYTRDQDNFVNSFHNMPGINKNYKEVLRFFAMSSPVVAYPIIQALEGPQDPPEFHGFCTELLHRMETIHPELLNQDTVQQQPLQSPDFGEYSIISSVVSTYLPVLKFSYNTREDAEAAFASLQNEIDLVTQKSLIPAPQKHPHHQNNFIERDGKFSIILSSKESMFILGRQYNDPDTFNKAMFEKAWEEATTDETKINILSGVIRHLKEEDALTFVNDRINDKLPKLAYIFKAQRNPPANQLINSLSNENIEPLQELLASEKAKHLLNTPLWDPDSQTFVTPLAYAISHKRSQPVIDLLIENGAIRCEFLDRETGEVSNYSLKEYKSGKIQKIKFIHVIEPKLVFEDANFAPAPTLKKAIENLIQQLPTKGDLTEPVPTIDNSGRLTMTFNSQELAQAMVENLSHQGIQAITQNNTVTISKKAHTYTFLNNCCGIPPRKMNPIFSHGTFDIELNFYIRQSLHVIEKIIMNNDKKSIRIVHEDKSLHTWPYKMIYRDLSNNQPEFEKGMKSLEDFPVFRNIPIEFAT